MNRRRAGILLTLTAGVFWGFSGACGQFLFNTTNIVSSWLVPIRLMIAGTVLMAYLFIKCGRKALLPWKDKKDARDLVIFGIAGMALSQYSYFTAIQYSNAGTATVIQYTGPLMILIYVCIKELRLPQLREMSALILALFGIFMLTTHMSFDNFIISGRALFWGIVAAVALAVYSLQPKRLIDKYGAVLVAGWGMVTGGIFLSVIKRPWNMQAPVISIEMIAAMSGIIVLGTVAAFCVYLKGVQFIGSSDAAMTSCIEPVASVMFASFWLGEKFEFYDISGMILIISAVLILSLSKKDVPENGSEIIRSQAG